MPPTSLLGLVLAGGASRRMSRDKGTLRYHGEPQAVHAWRLLNDLCGRAYVSTNARHAGAAPYSDLPLIVDEGDYRGPAAGLQAAWTRHPDAAWLTLAVDMPLVDRALLEELVAGRDVNAPATAFRHEDGTVEPLCTIWESTARGPLLEQISGGDSSLRRFLETHGAAYVIPSAPLKLRSVNDPAEQAALLEALSRPDAAPKPSTT
jgi:molybdopterin-guanine dinucleotide biosynthesis protein A